MRKTHNYYVLSILADEWACGGPARWWCSDMARKMVEVENVNHPGPVKLVDAPMYDAMKRALLKVLPKTSPGLTVEEIYARVAMQLPEDLFPAGAKAGWWAKTVQLDLEAKGNHCAREDAAAALTQALMWWDVGARPGMWCRRRGGGVARKEPRRATGEQRRVIPFSPSRPQRHRGSRGHGPTQLLVRVCTLEQTGTESHDHRQSGNEGAA